MVTAKKEQKDRVIALITGESGAGKTFFIASVKDALIYDTDLGGGAAYAQIRIEANNSERIEVSSYREILEDLRKRVRDGKLKNTVVIDHITGLQQEAVLRLNPNMESDFGRSASKATSEWRRIREFARTLDCNLICTAHLKGEWAANQEIGKTTDGAKNIEADMGIVLYLSHKKATPYPAQAQVIKWRRLPEDPRGPIPQNFHFTVEEFTKIAGSDLTRKRENIEIASPEQVGEANHLVKVVNLPEGTLEKWLKKVGVEQIEDAPKESVAKFIDFCKAQVAGKESK